VRSDEVARVVYGAASRAGWSCAFVAARASTPRKSSCLRVCSDVVISPAPQPFDRCLVVLSMGLVGGVVDERFRSRGRAVVCVVSIAGIALLGVPAIARARAAAATFSWFTEGVATRVASLPSLCCGYPVAMTVASDGDVLAGEGYFNSLGRMSLRPIPGSGQIVTLVSTPAGSVWALRPGEVVRSGPSGLSERFAVEGLVGGMTFGPNGSLWVTTDGLGFGGSNGPEVVELTRGGGVHVFPVPDRVERLGKIVAGADGNLWFAEQGGPAVGEGAQPPTRIARLTPAGQVTSWPIGSPGEQLLGLAAASSGVWFTLGSNRVDRISYGGHVTIFSHGIPDGAFPDGITKGPDGAMWFAELGADAIGRITNGGHVTQFPWAPLTVYGSESGAYPCGPCLPGGADSIVSGPDRTLWFSRPGKDEFGRLSVSPHCSVPRLLGREVSSVESVLSAAGCRLGYARAQSPASVVVRQSAPAGRLLASGASVGIEGVPASSAKRACVPRPGQRVVVADRRASLLAALEPTQTADEGTPFFYLLCVAGRSGPHRVKQISETLGGGQYSGATPGLFTLSGDYLAWQQTSSSYGQPFAEISILDARSGKEERTGDLSTSCCFNGTGAEATAIALDSAGDIGWLLEQFGSRANPSQAEQVQAQTPTGVRALESGPKGSFASLKIAPTGTLIWTRDGIRHSYVF
jgi:streptogramin lyase